MKKCVSLILVLLCCLGTLALAEQSTRVEFGNTFSLIRPSNLETIDLNEDDIAEGLVYAAVSDELEMYVQRYEMDDLTKDELYDMFREDEFRDGVAVVSSGGVEYVTYQIIDEGIGATCVCSDGNYYEFNFYCLTDAAEAQAREILQSIQAL